ncbi:MAG: two-component regulator propeller domain-containing protein [bacterium]
MRKIAFFFLSIFFMWAAIVKGSSWEWKTVTSFQRITGLCEGGSIVWCGTEGGLLAFDPVSSRFAYWTNTEGLASNDVTAIACDAEKRVWIGLGDGMIQRYDPDESEWLLVDDYRDHRITCLTVWGDTLFVGLDIGISIFLISRKEVKETYRRLGTAFQMEIPVNAVVVATDRIWAATDEGVAYASLHAVNLLDPGNWTDVNTFPGYPNPAVTSIVVQDNRVYAGGPSGISSWDGSGWTQMGTFHVYDLTVHEDQLYAAAENGIFFWDGTQWSALASASSTVHHLMSTKDRLWGGKNKGICAYSGNDARWLDYVPNSCGSNLISDAFFDASGVLWCCSRDRGFFRFDGVDWMLFNRDNVPDLSSNDFISAASAGNSRWFGTWGAGIVRLNENGTFRLYTAQNGFLSGVSEDPNYAVVPDMAVDPSSTLWILNYRSDSYLPLIAVTPDSVWTTYGVNEGFSTTFLKTIAVDSEGKKWIGSENEGVFILDDNSTPETKTDDPAVERITTNDGLESNRITAFAPDRRGGMWIGTPEGLYHYSAGYLTKRTGLPFENITALAADGNENVWVGTKEGLIVCFESTYRCSLLTKENSGLVSNAINSLFLEATSGTLVVGTNNGLSVLKTPYSEPRSDLSELKMYPNPFIPQQHAQLTIDDLTEHVTVTIFSASGYRVRHFSQDQIYGKRLIWSGTDDRGEPVPGGIYLVIIHAESGEQRVGKVAVVR